MAAAEGMFGLPEFLQRDVRGVELVVQAEEDARVEVADDDSEGVAEVVDFDCFVPDLRAGG